MIKIDKINFNFKDQEIFDNASLEIPNNGVYILKGDNGIGKSTLLKLMLGDLKLNDGSILIDNIKIDKQINEQTIFKIKQKISYISQENNLITFLNAQENASLYNIVRNKKLINLNLLNNDKFSKKKFKQLSSGEKLLISIERALNEKKHIFFLDECSDFLDDNNTNNFINKIDTLSKDNLFIIVSHDERIITHFPNTIIIKNKKIEKNDTIISNIESQKEFINEKIKLNKITSLYIFRNKLFFNILFIIFLIFNTLFISGLSLLTYPFKDSLYNTIENAYYTFISKEESLLNNIKYSNHNSIYINNLNKDEEELVNNSFEISYFEGYFNRLTIINDDISTSYIELSKSTLERNKYLINDDNKLSMHLICYNTSFSMNYKINNELPMETFLIHNKDLSNIEFNDSITLQGALWNNNIINFDETYNNNLFTLGSISFISPSLYETKYNKTIDFEITDQDLYYSHNLKGYYVDSTLKFFNYDLIDLNRFYKLFFNLNSIFQNATLKRNDDVYNTLSNKEVLISENNFKKISKLLYFKGPPCTLISNKTKKKFIKFIETNNLDFYMDIYDNDVKRKSYDTYYNYIHSNEAYYYSLMLLTIFLEACLIYIYFYSYTNVNKNNFRILNRYYSKKQCYFIFLSLFIISCTLSIILSSILSIFILKQVFKASSLLILPFHVTFISVIATILLNISFFVISYFY